MDQLDNVLNGGKIEKQEKNTCSKTRPRNNPYEIWQTPEKTWTWRVLKKWQKDDDKLLARWFCDVISPICPEGELGDVYVQEIKDCARRIK